ncbi:MAG TPA: hypothetical protein VEC35_08440 [Noviherbaspirillum sp.]|nr:hypothetical protein [Noviherbaspirillum sp.]
MHDEQCIRRVAIPPGNCDSSIKVAFSARKFEIIFPESISMNALPVQERTATRPPRMHCPYCGDDFLLSHGTRLPGYMVICPNVKCGSRIRMSVASLEERGTTVQQ